MKIGYIVLCHKDPELVSAIVNKVTVGTKNIAIIHVDLKVDIEAFKQSLLNNTQAVFLEKRTSIFWGGFSSIVATMDALEKALSYNCDRYVLLQGADYPLHTNEYIDEFFKKHKDVEFLKAYNITKSKRKISYMKCWGYHIYDGVDRNKKCIKTFIARGFEAINKLGIKYRKGYYFDKNENKRYDVYWGWGHFALTKRCVQYVLEAYKNKKGFNKYFSHTFPADETYLQTLVYNSPFADNTVDGRAVDESEHLTNESMLNLTYFEYPDIVLRFQNIGQIRPEKLKNKLYIRKIDFSFINSINL